MKSSAAVRKIWNDVDVVIVEDSAARWAISESLPFLEAIRQLQAEEPELRDNGLFVHVTLVPWIAAAQELKTKPTQHSVKELRALGIQPDILVCRSEQPIPEDVRDKIALFCDVEPQAVIGANDAKSVYEIPLVFAKQGVDDHWRREAAAARQGGSARPQPVVADGREALQSGG